MNAEKGKLKLEMPDGTLVPYEEATVAKLLGKFGVIPEVAGKMVKETGLLVRDATIGGVIGALEIEKIAVDYINKLVQSTVEANRQINQDVLQKYAKKVSRMEEKKE